MVSAVNQGKQYADKLNLHLAHGVRYKRLLLAMVLMPMMTLAGEVKVTGVAAKQRYPWNGKVDIVVTFTGVSNDLDVTEFTFTAANGTTREALPIVNLSRNGSAVASGTGWMRRFVWDAAADLGEVKIEDIILTVDAFAGVQLWENGPYWGSCNIGATKPEEYGYYFWWGDTVGYKYVDGRWDAADGSRSGFSFGGENCLTYNKNVSQLKTEGIVDQEGNLSAAYDAASAHLGAPWRMPTNEELMALMQNCDRTGVWMNGVSGMLIKGRGEYATKSIFLPHADYSTRISDAGKEGYYWSSTPDLEFEDQFSAVLNFAGRSFYVGTPDGPAYGYYRRYCGMTIRPVRGLVK